MRGHALAVDDVRLATETDAAEVGRIFAAGFADDPVLTWVFRAPGQQAKLTAFFAFLATEVFVPLGATYLLAGSCAAWTPPGSPEWSPELTERFGRRMSETATPGDIDRLGRLDTVQQSHHPSEAHWYLSVIATLPAARGQGQGTALLEHTIRRVDGDGLPAYLESTNPRNLTLYERHGFVVRERVDLDDGGPVLTAMGREAHRH